MKKIWILISLVLLVLVVSACAFYPVVSQAEFEARQTAQAQVVLPTVTPELPPIPTIEPEVLPAEEVGETLPDPTPEPPCVIIKGNISSLGEKIFHSPGQANYNNVKIDESKGEAFFCSTEEAEAAGFRAALR